MRRVIFMFTVAIIMSVSMMFGAVPAFATGGDDCNSNNSQNGALNNTNVLGSQQNQQGSCNDQKDNDNIDVL
jgi:hypothetical protein